MHKLTKNGEYYLYALSVIGLDGSGLNGRITFDMGNGTENVIHESGTIGIRELFTMTYRTYGYQRGVKVGGEWKFWKKSIAIISVTSILTLLFIATGNTWVIKRKCL